MSSVHGRRSFVSILASFAGFAAVHSGEEAAAQTPPATGEFDLSWLDQLQGKHKQVYDLGGFDLAEDQRPLRFCKNFLDTFRDVYKLESPAINTAVGISGGAMPMNVTDWAWEKYKLGERGKIMDPKTKQPAVRNIFYDGDDVSIKAMQARGTVFWQCNVALTNQAQQIARAMNLPPAEVRADLIKAFNPGVKLVPSHVMALALVQERGFSYMKA